MPGSSAAAPLTFVVTGYPGVMGHAGALHDFVFPVCGCDACDETAETTADRMERLVLTVAGGGYSERAGEVQSRLSGDRTLRPASTAAASSSAS